MRQTTQKKINFSAKLFLKLLASLVLLTFSNLSQAQSSKSKVNRFLAVEMTQNVLATYYPNNPDFDHFVFQQVLADGAKSDDDYTLIAYVVDHNGKVITDLTFDPPLSSGSLNAGNRIQFANISVYKDDLDKLFSNAPPTTSLKLYPKHSTVYPKHIAYRFEGGTNLTNFIIVDPSPPAPAK